MDFELNETQRSVLSALDVLLSRMAGVERCRELASISAYDFKLEEELEAGGFADIFAVDDEGPLTAVLAVERIARELGATSHAARLLVLPAIGVESVPPGPIVIRRAAETGPFRYGRDATYMLTIDGESALESRLDPAAATAVPSMYGYPLARVSVESSAVIEGVAGAEVEAWWRVALCAEAVGFMGRAFEVVLQYANDRRVFKRHLASFQALQHRLSELSLQLEAARWLTYEAAYRGAPSEAASVAASYTIRLASRFTREAHQLMGAVGLTVEHDLHLWTLRLQALRTDLGGIREHDRAITEARWGGSRRG